MVEFIIKENIIEKVTGKAIPKPANDQNTDDIIPARFMKEITFANMGKYVYFDERNKEGKEVLEHPFNDPKFSGGNILVAGANYGCGSSREHAPQALYRYGIRAIIAESFAEIFAGNCASLGVVGATIPKIEIAPLIDFLATNPTNQVTIDIKEKKVKYGDKEVALEMLEGRRQSFLNGTYDALTILQQNKVGIASVEQKLPYLHFK